MFDRTATSASENAAIFDRKVDITASSDAREDLVPDSQVTQAAIKDQVMIYQQKIKSTIDGINELEALFGPTIVPRVVNLAAKIACADINQQQRPSSVLLKMLPGKFAGFVNTFSTYTGYAVDLGILPMATLERIADSHEETAEFLTKLKGITK